MVFSEHLGLIVTSVVSLIVGLTAHRVQLDSSKQARGSARELAEIESLNSMVNTLRTEIRELRQVNVDLRELYHKSVLENQALRHDKAQQQQRMDKLNLRLVELQKENLSLREERVEYLAQISQVAPLEEG